MCVANPGEGAVFGRNSRVPVGSGALGRQVLRLESYGNEY